MSGLNAVEEYLKSIGKTRKELFESLRGVTGKLRREALREYKAAKKVAAEARQIKRNENNDNKKNVKKKKLTKNEKRKLLVQEARKNNLIPDVPKLDKSKGEIDTYIKKGVFLLEDCDLVVISDPAFPQVHLPFPKKEKLLSKFKSFSRTDKAKLAIGETFAIGGVFIFVCLNKFTSKLLQDFLDTHDNILEDGTRFMVSGIELLKRYFLVKINFPGELIDQHRFYTKLTVQNPHMNVHEWIIKSSSNQEGGFQCIFSVPEVAFKVLGLTSFTVCYNVGIIKAFLIIDNNFLAYGNPSKLNNLQRRVYKAPYRPSKLETFLPNSDSWMGYRK